MSSVKKLDPNQQNLIKETDNNKKNVQTTEDKATADKTKSALPVKRKNLSISDHNKKKSADHHLYNNSSLLVESDFHTYTENMVEAVCYLYFKWSYREDKFIMPEKIPEKLSHVLSGNQLANLQQKFNSDCSKKIKLWSVKKLAMKFNYLVLLCSMVCTLGPIGIMVFYTYKLEDFFILIDIFVFFMVLSGFTALYTFLFKKKFNTSLDERSLLLKHALEIHQKETHINYMDFTWSVGKYGSRFQLKYPSLYADLGENLTDGLIIGKKSLVRESEVRRVGIRQRKSSIAGKIYYNSPYPKSVSSFHDNLRANLCDSKNIAAMEQDINDLSVKVNVFPEQSQYHNESNKQKATSCNKIDNEKLNDLCQDSYKKNLIDIEKKGAVEDYFKIIDEDNSNRRKPVSYKELLEVAKDPKVQKRNSYLKDRIDCNLEQEKLYRIYKANESKNQMETVKINVDAPLPKIRIFNPYENLEYQYSKDSSSQFIIDHVIANRFIDKMEKKSVTESKSEEFDIQDGISVSMENQEIDIGIKQLIKTKKTQKPLGITDQSNTSQLPQVDTQVVKPSIFDFSKTLNILASGSGIIGSRNMSTIPKKTNLVDGSQFYNAELKRNEDLKLDIFKTKFDENLEQNSSRINLFSPRVLGESLMNNDKKIEAKGDISCCKSENQSVQDEGDVDINVLVKQSLNVSSNSSSLDVNKKKEPFDVNMLFWKPNAS